MLYSKVPWPCISGKEKTRNKLRREVGRCHRGRTFGGGNQGGQTSNKKTKEWEHSMVQKRSGIVPLYNTSFKA
jgi:hypothetical protein